MKIGEGIPEARQALEAGEVRGVVAVAIDEHGKRVAIAISQMVEERARYRAVLEWVVDDESDAGGCYFACMDLPYCDGRTSTTGIHDPDCVVRRAMDALHPDGGAQ